MTARRHGYRVVASVAGVFFLGVCEMRAAQEPPAAADAALRTFVGRVEAYARLHQRLEAPLPPIETTADPLSRLMNRRYLASAIRAARRHAKPGDIFTPDVADVLRTRLAEGLPAAETAGGAHRLARRRVGNGGRRRRQRTVSRGGERRPSPQLLEHLPPLPGGIQYRICRFGSRALGRSCGHRHRCPARCVPCAISLCHRGDLPDGGLCHDADRSHPVPA